MTATAAAAETAPSKEDELNARNAATPETGVQCAIDEAWVHSVELHLKLNHPHLTLAQYQMKHPTHAVESGRIRELRAAKAAGGGTLNAASSVLPFPSPAGSLVKPFHEVLGMKMSPAFKNAMGNPIMCPVLGAPDSHCSDFMADVDNNYVFQPDMFKDLLLGFALNIPTLLWGFHGTGKTTAIEQFCARTNRPWLRIQHTVSTEEAHIVGQYVVKADHDTGRAVTHFEAGPLAYAMKYGLVYCADEYDFALPSVTSVYQPVLEGKPLIIKEAPPEWRVVKPHPNFRFLATGNTNGSGDETGLYQGTQIMNAANYSRFGVTLQVNYMEPAVEVAVVQKQGNVHADDARNFVNFAKSVRDAYAASDITVTVSPRELINAAKTGLAKGGQWRKGLELAYINRLSTVDRKAVDAFAQRIFGGGHS